MTKSKSKTNPSIDAMDISIRLYQCLKAAGIFHLSDIISLTRQEFLDKTKLTPTMKSYLEMEELLKDKQLSFAKEITKLAREKKMSYYTFPGIKDSFRKLVETNS